MESPQVTTDTASSPQPGRQWVWRATLESRAAGKVSVLACVETVFAVALYWWVAIRWETHWHLVTSVFVAPLLLLRSPESIAAGVRWFMKDWCGLDGYPSWSSGAKLCVRIPLYVAAAVPAYFFWHWLHKVFFTFGYLGEEIGVACVSAITLFCMAFLGYALITAVWRNLADVFGLARKRFFLFPITFALLSGTFLEKPTAWSVLATVLLTAIFCFLGFLAGAPSGCGFGYAIRAFVIRVLATLRYVHRGIVQIPSNWRENNLLTDVAIPAELLPEIRTAADGLSLDGFFRKLRGAKPGGQYGLLVVSPFLFLPAFLYRLNIKATAWFWWPLAFLLRPVKQSTVAEDQREALCWPWTNPFQKLLFVGISLLAMAVLFVRHVDPVRWSRLSKVEGVWTPVKALLALDWLHFPPWHWAIFVSAVCGIGMLALAGGAVSCAANKKWPPPGLGWKVKAMESLVRVRSLATVALLFFSLGALFIAHTPWHAHVPLPASWYSAMKHFYRVSEPEAKR